MALDLSTCRFSGPALPEPFVRFELEKELKDLLPKTTGDAGRELVDGWEVYRRHLRELVSQGGPIRVRNAVIEPLLTRLGYETLEDPGEIATREGRESGGWLLSGPGGKLRVWATALADDLDAPTKRGHAYRFSHLRVAQRVLLATNERIGLLTNGVELRILISDPARADSQIEIPVESHWKRNRDVPDSFRLVLALCSPRGVQALPDLIEKARLKQTGVTKELRKQARQAVELFVQDLLDNPANADILREHGFGPGLPIQNPKSEIKNLPAQLWHEGLINIFRLLFILKMEAVGDPARVFSFASTSLWRNTFSPSVALAKVVRDVLDRGAQTGRFLEDGLRALYRMFTDGLTATEINVKPLGGALFGPDATPLISQLAWSEQAVAHLLDRLLWTPKLRGTNARERVHYGPLTVQDLGRVYESLIELEPGITTESMCRLRRSKLEVVVPVEQGQKYKKTKATADNADDADGDDTSDEADEADSEKGKKTKIEWIEEIPEGRFFLRVGLGRKASGSYYTPDSFVKFLVQETLGPLCAERSPKDDPQPLKILGLKVADIAMGSGHFLFEACDFLADKLYEACRQCDELAMKAEAEAEKLPQSEIENRKSKMERADAFRRRVLALPDPNDELMAYLPSRAPEDGLVGFSAAKALALCKRLVAVHCLYGVDLNPLAVELAKLSLWIETHAEGLPLTFLDHRFVVGNSLTGPFFDHLLKYPGSQQAMDDLFTQGLKEKFTATLESALREVHDLEATVGINLGEIEAKKAAKARMDALLDPFKLVGHAWSGGVMLGKDGCDDTAYAALLKAVAEGSDGKDIVAKFPMLGKMVETGFQSLEFDLAFPDVFFRTGKLNERSGFDVVLGNPPWDQLEIAEDEFWAQFDIEAIASRDHRERKTVIARLMEAEDRAKEWRAFKTTSESLLRHASMMFQWQSVSVGDDKTTGRPDLWRLFGERAPQLLAVGGKVGLVIPAAFHGNEGATGIRRLYLNHLALKCCYSFENRKKLFEIDSRFKFALVVAENPGPTQEFACGFYLHDQSWLFSQVSADRQSLHYTASDINALGGPHLLFLEARSQQQFDLARSIRSNSKVVWSHFLEDSGIGLSNGIECHRRPDIAFSSPSETHLVEWVAKYNPDTAAVDGVVLADGKHINAYSLQSHYPIREFARLWELSCSSHWGLGLGHFRMGLRYVAASTNERTVIASVLPPIVGFTNGIVGETTPSKRPTCVMLSALSLISSFSFDYQVRQQATTHVNRYVLAHVGVPDLSCYNAILAHLATRLLSSASIFSYMWTEQLGDAWREPKSKHTWPVLEGDDERWAVRAAIDAVVAEAYGLTRGQYAHVLSTFSHKSYPKAPDLCLARFDELKTLGLEAFTKKHDPYWDIPLNENLPQPVIDLPKLHRGDAKGAETTGKKRGRKKAAVVREAPAQYTLDFGGKG